MPSNHLILCHLLLLLPSIFPSIRVFSNESALYIRQPKYWSFSFNISPSNEHPGLSSLMMDWLDLLAVQGTLKRLLQNESQTIKEMAIGTYISIITLNVKVKVKSLSRVQLFATPWTIVYQASPSMGFSRQEYWSGLPFPSPGDLPDPRVEPGSPALEADALTSWATRGWIKCSNQKTQTGWMNTKARPIYMLSTGNPL